MRDKRTYRIIGCAMEVHKELGCGFLEAVYQEALGREFAEQGVPFESQPVIRIEYKGKLLDKAYQPDFICFEKVIVEIKALSIISGTEEAQILNYLKATGLKVGILLNFGSKSLEYKRFVYNLCLPREISFRNERSEFHWGNQRNLRIISPQISQIDAD